MDGVTDPVAGGVAATDCEKPESGHLDEVGHALTGEPAERFRWMFRYGIDGDLRFISHADTLRLFQRALTRAKVPVRYTQGFNPHPRMMIPLPRPVGIASQAEALVVETECCIDPAETSSVLSQQTPAGMCVRDARRLATDQSPQPALARYHLEVGEQSPEDLDASIQRVLSASSIRVKRRHHGTGTVREIDVRPYLTDLFFDGHVLQFSLRVTGTGTARPSEIAELLGYNPESINHRIRRMEIQWQ